MPAVVRLIRDRWLLRARVVGEVHSPSSRAASPARVQRSFRSRRALLFGLLIFVAIQALSNLAIRCEWCTLRDPLYFDKLALFRSSAPEFFEPTPGTPPIKVLFTGSSRTQNGVDAGAIQAKLTQQLGRPVSSFNFALAGCGPVTNAIYLRRLAGAGAKPDIVLLEVHPVFLAGQRPDYPETRWLVPVRLRRDELEVIGGMGFPAKPSSAAGWRGWLACWYEYRYIIVDRYASALRTIPKLNDGHEPDVHGFVRVREVTEQEREVLTALTFGQYRDYFPDFRPNGPGVAALRDMLDTCRANGWKGALFVPPESAQFRGWYSGAGLRELDEVLRSLAAEYGVPLIDARAWLPETAIGDGHHLCGSGADLLTAKLVRDVLAPWLATLTPSTHTRP